MIGMSGLPSSVYAYRLNDGRSEKHHQVADDVDDQVDEERKTGDADEELHPDRRIEHATT